MAERARSTPQPQALHYSCELGGLVLEDQPIPWNADVVLVEARVRVAAVHARLRDEFSLRVHGERLPPESVQVEEGTTYARCFFRLATPAQSTAVELLWRERSLGQMALPILTCEEFTQALAISHHHVAVPFGAETATCQVFVTAQVKELTASALITAPTSLAPLRELGLRFRLHSAAGQLLAEAPVRFAGSQLLAREALVSVVVKKPRRAGLWLADWAVGAHALAATRLQGIAASALTRSLRVSALRYVVQDSGGPPRLVRVLPQPGSVVRVGPCFWVSSNLSGVAGWCDFEVLAQSKNSAEAPLSQTQRVLLTDGATPILAGTVAADELEELAYFELRCGKRSLGKLPLASAPEAQFTSEGGFAPPDDFLWSPQADEQLRERLGRLLG